MQTVVLDFCGLAGGAVVACMLAAFVFAWLPACSSGAVGGGGGGGVGNGGGRGAGGVGCAG